MNTPLLTIAMMNYEQLSAFVNKATKGEKYIAKPAEASVIDCDICAEAIINIVIMPALKNDHARRDSRSLKVGESDYQTATQLASASRTWFVDRGFIISQNARITRAISAQKIDEEKAEAKADMIALQLDTIGCMIGAKKAHKKDAIQGFWDFEESALIAQKMEDEGTAGKLNTLEFETNYQKAIAC